MKRSKFKKVDTELKYGLSYEFSLVLFAVMILTFINVVVEIRQIISPALPTLRIKSILNLIITLLTIYYASYEYKKPHGNLLKYIMMLFAISIMLKIVLTESKPNNVALSIICMAIVAYMSGRLDRYRKNTYLAIFVAGLFFAKSITILSTGTISLGKFFSSFETLIIWVAIFAAYVARFKIHIEAGQQIKAKTNKK